MPDSLLIRAEASPRIGTGHVMRCLALAQRWRRHGGRVIFAQRETVPALATRLRDEEMATDVLAGAAGSADEARETITLAGKSAATWIVADGYVFGAAWQKQIKAAGFRLLVIDDYGHAERYYADLVLNQNAAADEARYARREPTTRLLLGTRYTLLRTEFLRHRPASREVSAAAKKILVTLGGADADNVTGAVIEALLPLAGVEAVVVIGASNPHLDAVKKKLTAHPAIRLVVNAANMPELMAWADVAISAAGSTAWELAYMGLPSVLIVTADNQLGIAEALGREGISVNLGSHRGLAASSVTDAIGGLLTDGSRRQEMSRKGSRLIDGQGADRVLSFLGGAQ